MFGLLNEIFRPTATLNLVSIVGLMSCASLSSIIAEAEKLPVRTLYEVTSEPIKFDNQKVRLKACLDFHGHHKYGLWNFDLLPLKADSTKAPYPGIFVEGKKIAKKYRKNDIIRERKISENKVTHEVVKDFQWEVEIYGTFLNDSHELNTGGHIIVGGFFEFTLADAVVIREITEGCPNLYNG